LIKKMTHLNPIEVAHRYFVTDRLDASIPATRLRNILESLQQGRQLSSIALNYLQKQGLASLERLAQSEVTYEAFCEFARVEQVKREFSAQAEREAKEAEKQASEAAWAVQYALQCQRAENARIAQRQRAEDARIARESDPKYIDRVRNQQLLGWYGLEHFIRPVHFDRVMQILRRVDGGNRFTDDDVLWLKTEGKDYYSDRLQTVFHEREAEFFAGEHKRTKDAWMAVNASSHYRKCGQPKKAHDLLASISVEKKNSSQLKSALCTTHGGVMRDLERWDKALELGHLAHSLTSKDFRPCTLLGAVHMELGDYEVGQTWYKKAIERGASERSIDHDLRGIFLRADKAKREEIKAFLLREDPVRYGWVNNQGSANFGSKR
jgi:hypothetical protein